MKLGKVALVLLAACANGPASLLDDRHPAGDPESESSTTLPGDPKSTADAASSGGSDGGGGGLSDAGDGGASTVVAVGTGVAHTCALTAGGVVKCWGNATHGQIGNGVLNGPDVAVPFSVPNVGGIAALAVGTIHTCALEKSGGAKCWGHNDFGTLGNGTVIASASPVSVVGLGADGAIVTMLQGGSQRNAAITNAGGVLEWGAFVEVNKATAQASPTPIVGLGSGTVAVTAGHAHSCALTAAGGVKCWGYNVQGQCGDGSNANARATPVDVVGLSSGVKAISAGGYHTCALLTSGTVKCWGYNSYGQLGDGTAFDQPLPVTAGGLGTNVVALAAGVDHTCALTSVGGVACWGGNGWGQLGNGGTTSSNAPVPVVGLSSGVVAISGGSYHVCALTNAGAVRCWGYNSNGQLGAITPDQRSAVPITVSGL